MIRRASLRREEYEWEKTFGDPRTATAHVKAYAALVGGRQATSTQAWKDLVADKWNEALLQADHP
jgi:hypothetical protein